MLAAIALFLILWMIGCLVSTCIIPTVCTIIGIDEEVQVVTSIIVFGLFLAIIAMVKIMGG